MLPIPFRPLHDNVLIDPDPLPNMVGKLHVVSEKTIAPWTGTVVCCGPGARAKLGGKLLPMTIKPGDRVWYGNYGPTRVKLDKEYVTCSAENLLAVEEK